MTDCSRCWWYGKPIECPADFDIDTKVCKNFTPNINGKDVVEVVRCKDCKYGRKPNSNISPEKYFKTEGVVCECNDVVGDEPMIYVPNHFCSYGERRVNNNE